jgi:hypothetical protein
MALISLDYKILWDDFEDLCHTAGFGGIDGWAHKWHINKQDRMFTIVDEELTHHHISQAVVERVIADLFNRKKFCIEATWKSIELAVLENEYSEIDAEDASIILQYACFGEIVYG